MNKYFLIQYLQFSMDQLKQEQYYNNKIEASMLRRCMTPNPHSKAKYLSQLMQFSENPRKEVHKINYDSFFYIDKLTNNKIQLGQAKTLYAHNPKSTIHLSHQPHQHQPQQNPPKQRKDKQHHSTAITSRQPQHPQQLQQQQHKQLQKQYSQSKEMQEINDCFTIMKSTKLFQMENLKNRLFSKAEDNEGDKENNQIDSMIKKKKQIRELIEQHLNALCLAQFRKYMELSTQKQKIKLINPNLLTLHKTIPNKITKQNLQKIIDQFLQSEQNCRKKHPPPNISLQDINFPDEGRLKELLMHRMGIKNKEFEHLVTPDRMKQIYRQIYSNVQEKVRGYMDYGEEKDIGGYNFGEFVQQAVPKFEKSKKSKWKAPNKKIELKKKQLLIAIQSGSIYDFLFLIIRWPTLLHYKDDLGNNLLHLAGKRNQAEIYSILIKKMGMQALREKNNCGKTPVEVTKLFGSVETQKINEEYQSYL